MANGLKTALLLGLLSGLLLVIGELAGGANGLVIAFVFAAIMNFVSYWFSDKIVLRMYRAQEVGPGHPLYQITERLARQGGLPMPKVYIIPDSSPERVRDRPQSRARGGGGDRGHPAGARRARARGRDRARAGAREASRHPDQLRRRDDCRGDHDVRPHGDVCGAVRAATAATSAKAAARIRSRCSR